MWPRTDNVKPLPPPIRRLPGRPKTRRRKHVTEESGSYKKLRAVGGRKVCKNCWEKGHNKRTCKNPTRPQPPKEQAKIGRPRTREAPTKWAGQTTQTTQTNGTSQTNGATGSQRNGANASQRKVIPCNLIDCFVIY